MHVRPVTDFEVLVNPLAALCFSSLARHLCFPVPSARATEPCLESISLLVQLPAEARTVPNTVACASSPLPHPPFHPNPSVVRRQQNPHDDDAAPLVVDPHTFVLVLSLTMDVAWNVSERIQSGRLASCSPACCNAVFQPRGLTSSQRQQRQATAAAARGGKRGKQPSGRAKGSPAGQLLEVQPDASDAWRLTEVTTSLQSGGVSGGGLCGLDARHSSMCWVRTPLCCRRLPSSRRTPCQLSCATCQTLQLSRDCTT